MESVHCQGFVARGKMKGRSRPPNNSYYIRGPWSSQAVIVVKNPPSNAGDMREASSVLGLERSPGGEHGNPLQFSCPENPWTEEPDRLQSVGSQRVRHDRSDLAGTHMGALPWASIGFTAGYALLPFSNTTVRHFYFHVMARKLRVRQV